MNLKNTIKYVKYAVTLTFITVATLAIMPLHRSVEPESQTETSRLNYRPETKTSQSDVKEPEQQSEEQQARELISLGEFDITYYCPCERCCGKSPSDASYGKTATGTFATPNHTIAVDPAVIPYGREVVIEGMKYIYRAEDCGGGVNQKHIDIFVAYHEEALQLGRKKAEVWLVEE